MNNQLETMLFNGAATFENDESQMSERILCRANELLYAKIPTCEILLGKSNTIKQSFPSLEDICFKTVVKLEGASIACRHIIADRSPRFAHSREATKYCFVKTLDFAVV